MLVPKLHVGGEGRGRSVSEGGGRMDIEGEVKGSVMNE